MNKERIEKFIEFLEALPPEKFNFDLMITKFDSKLNCGTVCCAAGWLPKFDPENWAYCNDGGIPSVESLIEERGGSIIYAIANYFNLQRHEVGNIFYNQRTGEDRNFFYDCPNHDVQLTDVINALKGTL